MNIPSFSWGIFLKVLHWLHHNPLSFGKIETLGYGDNEKHTKKSTKDGYYAKDLEWF